MVLVCGVCGRQGSILVFSYIPYPEPGKPRLESYESRIKCPDCGSESIEEKSELTK